MSPERQIEEVLARYVRASDNRDGAPEPPVRPVESGYFEIDLQLRDTAWKIVRSDVKMDLPLQ
ncbi:hypothetical protein [Mycolicibacterium wolinskyi]|uniref:hypothetical protein n=1 Tax=Mycolicibacterium wolinskyi TaxID=59750 RepID=UPI003917773C